MECVKNDYYQWKQVMVNKRQVFLSLNSTSRFMESWWFFISNFSDSVLHLPIVVEFIISIQITVVDNERSHSVRKIIQTALRNGLKYETIDNLMRLIINGAAMDDEQQIIKLIKKAMIIWKQERERRFI